MAVTITDVAVFDGTRVLPGRHDVTVDGDRIVVVEPSGASGATDTVVGTGATLLPGLVDGHVHLLHPREFGLMRAAGVTSAADMGTWPPEHVAALRGAADGFAFRTPGAPLVGPGGPHSRFPGLADSIVRTPQDARRLVAQRVAEGVDHLKLVLEAPGRGGPDHAGARAATTAAHAAGLRVVAHAPTVGAVEQALDVGVDVLTHAPVDAPVDRSLVDRIAGEGKPVTPTLCMMLATARSRDAEPGYAHARRFVRDLHEAGVTLVAGTDANAAPGAPASVPHGTAVHRELELLVGAGLTPGEALHAATAQASSLFAWRDRGVVRPGARADLLLVEGDPLADISAVRRIRQVWSAGVPVGR